MLEFEYSNDFDRFINISIFIYGINLLNDNNFLKMNMKISIQDIQKYIMKIQSIGTAILITDHNVKNLFDITDRSYVLGENTVVAEGTSRELLKSTKAIKHYFGSDFS